jgi:putative endonuclease
MQEFVVYILVSLKNGGTYVGMTESLILRFKSHNFFGKGFTAKHRPWMVIHVEFFDNKVVAAKREKYFKSGRGLYVKNEIVARWAHTLPQGEGRQFESDPRN